MMQLLPCQHNGQATAVASKAFTSRKKPVRLLSDSSASSDGESKSDGINLKPQKTESKVPLTLSGSMKPSPPRKFPSYDEASKGYEKRKLELES
ncbi:hypothetical protein RvY_04344 [Ramazzottius varieornatus]|uniref:Uncharacterized protein n=1 Tax=Ramazzottius varieornatus TaxID=947166 RepID=A0A1D1URB4_RAMVA|nr:hypothetical protein RvY_04344 [Ramazzottius varieornatus]